MENKFNKRVSLYDREIKSRVKNTHFIDKDSIDIIEHFRNNVKNIKKRSDIVDYLGEHDLIEESHDMLRFQIVYLMSAMDLFMHEIYSFGLMKIFNHERPKTQRYSEYKIPLKLLEKALYDTENIDHILKEEFIEINSNHTFMSPSRIREILNIISSDDVFALAEKEVKNNNVIEEHIRLDNVLEHIYERRNKIAHQTDINHGTDYKNLITSQEVDYYINVISHFVEEVYQIICRE